MVVPPVDHDCVLKDVVVELSNELAKMRHEIAQLKKAHIGPKTERSKMPRVPSTPPTAEQQLATRAANAKQRAESQTVRVEHKVSDEKRTCPSCGNAKLKLLGKGRLSTVWEFVPASFVKHEHVQEVLKCKCGDYVVAADAPKIIEGGRYGASVLAHLVVAKCADHLPLYRLEKDFRRQGFPLARSTMNELLHRAATITQPISRRLLEKIRTRDVVQADETRMLMQNGGGGKPKNGFVWTFVAADDDGETDVALVFAPDRSAETPRKVLQTTKGFLVVDAYAGYNAVVDVDGRTRAACHAHLRRYFHEALQTAPVAQVGIDLILGLYRVEHEARDAGIVGSPKHLELRRTKSPAIRERLRSWLVEQRPHHPPRSPMGVAIQYGLKRWDDLGRFLDDARVPLDNNASERALRRVALGRKNYLFVGDANAGANIAGLYSLIATCETRGINPFAYFVDVIGRVQDHPAAKLDELLPGAWGRAA